MKRKARAYGFVLICLALLIAVPAMGAKPGTIPGDVQYERAEGNDSEMGAFPPAIFPHWVHRINYRCDVCHDRLFEMKHGATPVTMDLMKEGKVCGACHNGEQAFYVDFKNCHRCHVATAE